MTMDDNAKTDEDIGTGQFGGIGGPDGAVSHYRMTHGEDAVIIFGSKERPGVSPMYVDELRHHLHYKYHVQKPEGGWRKYDDFSVAEKARLRPVAETLAMLDGNAFFGLKPDGDVDHYEYYLPEADALYQANGGDTGWAGEAALAVPAPGKVASDEEHQGWSIEQEFDTDPMRDDESVLAYLCDEARRLGMIMHVDKAIVRAALLAALPEGRAERIKVLMEEMEPVFSRHEGSSAMDDIAAAAAHLARE